MYRNFILLLTFFNTLFISCIKENNLVITGFKPIYIPPDSLYHIYNADTQAIVNAGNILIWNNFLFINEVNKGIHVIDKSYPSLAKKITFIKIYGNKNFSIADSTLFADNGRDLLTIDIHDIYHVVLIDILKDAISDQYNLKPDSTGYFECIETNKGYVIGWQKSTLTNPKCSSY